MTADNAFIAFMSISMAAIGLALVIGSGQFDRHSFMEAMSVLIPGKVEKDRLVKLDKMTRAADRAMAARARGERPGQMAGF